MSWGTERGEVSMKEEGKTGNVGSGGAGWVFGQPWRCCPVLVTPKKTQPWRGTRQE